MRRHFGGEQVKWSAAACALGRVGVARSAAGVCGVALADGDEDAGLALRAMFPSAELEHEPAGEATARLAEAVGRPGGAGELALPLDVRGTPFQLKVWDALRAIPPGQTRTYKQLAESVGSPRGTRAVASACGWNRLAVVIPCHRVIGADGSMRGFRWGIERKRALLEREAKPAHEDGRA